MNRMTILAVLALLCGTAAAGVGAQQRPEPPKPQVPLVTAVGCASRLPDGTWMLNNATTATDTKTLFSSTKELDEAKKLKLGTNRYKLLGTNEWVTKEELLKDPLRAQFTRPEAANATGTLQNGRKVVVKGLLITTSTEKRLNLVSLLPIADICK